MPQTDIPIRPSCGWQKFLAFASALGCLLPPAFAGSSAAQAPQAEMHDKERATLFEPFADLIAAPMSCKSTGGIGWSREELRKDAEKGQVDAMLVLAASYRQFEPHDEQSARYWYSRALKTGNWMAHFSLAQLHFCGWLYPQDHGKAVLHLERAAAAGGTAAARELGSLHEVGVAVAKDHSKALAWYRLSDSIDYARAMYQGIGIPPNPAAAFEWLKKTNDVGDAKGYGRLLGDVKYNLALMYLQGIGVARNEESGRVLLRQVVNKDVVIKESSRNKAQALLQMGSQRTL